MNVNRITAMLMLSGAAFFSQAASYEIQELPTTNLSFNQFSSSIDNTGLMLTLISQPFNPPIDLSLITLDNLPLTDPDAAALGNFNAVDLAIISSVIFAQTSSNSVYGQKLANFIAYETDGTDFDYVRGLDSETEATNGFTFSMATSLGDSVNGSHIVGTMAGPYSQIDYTNAENTDFSFNVNGYNFRAFVQVDEQITELLAPELSAGGISEAKAINDNLMVAGTSSFAMSTSLMTDIANCEDDDIRADEPVETCIYSLINQETVNQFTGQRTNAFVSRTTRRATTWQLDNAGNVIDRVVYGLTFEPEADNTVVLISEAVDVNNSDIAVGSTIISVDERFTQAAALFEGGVSTRLVADDALLPNRSVGINDNGYVVGIRQQRINNTFRDKMFVYNTNTDEVTFPTDFFISSASTARAINNNNLVVGDGEIDAAASTRPRNGFLYDIDADTFTNLNTLVACDSPFQIIAANDINDSNEIIADALVKKPRKDFKGEIFLDENGEQELIDVVVAVKLIPTGNAPVDCEPTEDELATTERQGAGLGFLTMLGLCMIAFTRRFKKVD